MAEDVEKQIWNSMVKGYRNVRGTYIGLRCVFAGAAWPWRNWRQFTATLGAGTDMTHTLPVISRSLTAMRAIGDQRLVTGWNMAQRRMFPREGGGPSLTEMFGAYSGLMREGSTRYAELSVEADKALAARGMGLYSRQRHQLKQSLAIREHIRLLDGMAQNMDQLGARVEAMPPASQDMLIRCVRRDLRKIGLAPS